MGDKTVLLDNDMALRELLYLCTLTADEFPDYICSLPFTFVESIIETALNDEDFMMDMLTAKIEILKMNTSQNNTKRALRKLKTACVTLGVLGYFDFGDWELFNRDEVAQGNNEPIKIIKDLIEAGQLDKYPVNGKYKPYKTMPQFIQWCFDNGYKGDISPEFILNNIYFSGNGGNHKRSIQAYINSAKEVQ